MRKKICRRKKREENVQDDSPRVSSQPSSSFSDSGSSFVLSLSVCCFIKSSPSEEIVCKMENFVTSAGSGSQKKENMFEQNMFAKHSLIIFPR